jgi:DNA-binding transcriptional ArsR family regulator
LTLVELSDEPLAAFVLACGASYGTLRSLYAREVTAKTLGEERGISVQTIGSQLRALETAGLVRVAGISGRAVTYTLSDYGLQVIGAITGRASIGGHQLAWVVAVAVEEAVPDEVEEELRNAGGDTFTCAGDIDFISLFPQDAHDLALALAGRLRERGARPSRALVLP